MPIDPMLKPVLPTFLTEAEGIAQSITRNLLLLERGEGTEAECVEAFTDIARKLHTLKGTAATFGLAELSDMAHRMEDVFGPFEGAQKLPSEVADAIFVAVDAFVARVRAYTNDEDGAALPDLTDALEELAAARGEAAGGAQKPDAGRPAPAAPADGGARPGFGGGQDTAEVPALDDAASWRVASKDVLYLMSEAERLRELRLRLEERAGQLTEGLTALSAVDFSQEHIEEARSRLIGVRSSLTADTDEAASIVDALEEGIKSLCTLPVATILEPMHRQVRDLCRQTGKKAKLSVVGGEISLDRRLLQSLRGPLVHLLRNAVDHGIEMPNARDAAGKHLEGAITLRLEQQGNILFVEMADDGGGLDVETIRQVAVQKGLTSPEEAARMERREVYEYIFHPGFSTRSSVNETSGRGVGLEAVRNQLRGLQGYIEVLSEPGQGTRFVLTLPAELGSSPISDLARRRPPGRPPDGRRRIDCRESSFDKLKTSRSRVLFEYRDQLIALKDFGALLGQRHASVPQDRQPLLILNAQGKRVAIAVDTVVGDRDLVIRALPEELRTLRAYQGAATLARGESLLILRPNWLLEQDMRDETAAAPRALVVDDSIAARAMHRTVLESGGFIVHTAASGEQALEKVRFAPYAVVVCDMHMEGMDGLQLISALRSRPGTQRVPVILVSVSDDDELRRQAITAGADAFLTKKSCVSGRLLAEVQTIIAKRKSA